MKKLFVILLVLLVFPLAACRPKNTPPSDSIQIPTIAATAVPIQENNANSTNQVTGETAVDTAAAAESSAVAAAESAESTEPETDEASNEDSGPTVINLDDFLLYDEPLNTDYLTTLEFYMKVQNASGELEEVGRVYAEGARTIQPNASTITFNMSGGAGGGLGETMTITQIEDMFYYVAPPSECIFIGSETGFENPFALFLDTGGSLAGEVERVLPNENINGVNSRHYKIKPDNFLSIAVNEIYDGDLYIAEAGDYVTRLRIYGAGKDEVLSGSSGQEGEIYYELNFTPSNEVMAILAPAGCGKTSTISEIYPVLPDAVSVISMEELFTYETQTPLEQVVEFYKTEMTKDGKWALVQELVQSPNATLTFTGQEGTVMVSMGPGQAGGTQIGIIPMP